ncbi:MAG: hypothetical protein KDB07_02975 [Planctomycetes bacterium]|nr:hypothetical protein [Planctomycetota bacterium]
MEQFYLDQAGLPAAGEADHEGAVRYDDVPDVSLRELPPDAEMTQVFRAEDRAKYTIEIRFGKYRRHDHAVCRIDMWVNDYIPIGDGDNPQGRSVGTDHMFVCGYPDCGKPIQSKFVGAAISPHIIQQAKDEKTRWDLIQGHWAVCPHCLKAERNNNGRQVASAEFVGYKLNHDTKRLMAASNNTYIRDPHTGVAYPTIRDCIMVAATPEHIATLLARLWDDLEGNADVSLRYNPKSIREQMSRGVYNFIRPNWDDKDEEAAVYPLKNIVRDTSAGASLVKRFRAFIMS